MQALSMTSFVDVVQKTGLPKLNALAAIKRRIEEGYAPRMDYYKGVRECIIKTHQRGNQREDLPQAREITSNDKKWINYEAILEGYRRFWGKKDLQWFEPYSDYWIHGDLSVKVNPELGLYINGLPHLIKLYFKADGLSKKKADLSLSLMYQSLAKDLNGEPLTFSVLDIRQHKLFSSNNLNPNSVLALKGEAAYICEIWKGL